MDRNGTKIATSERIYNVILDAKVMLSNEKYKEPTIEILKSCFDIQDEDIREVIEKNPSGRYNIMKKGVDYETAQEFEKKEEKAICSDM